MSGKFRALPELHFRTLRTSIYTGSPASSFCTATGSVCGRGSTGAILLRKELGTDFGTGNKYQIHLYRHSSPKRIHHPHAHSLPIKISSNSAHHGQPELPRVHGDEAVDRAKASAIVAPLLHHRSAYRPFKIAQSFDATFAAAGSPMQTSCPSSVLRNRRFSASARPSHIGAGTLLSESVEPSLVSITFSVPS